ncbi:unnamed protein product [Ilex paraguariensis]|uniref:Uncharacterized protein n=1 Tax=Ilex paraguariensis TaxID=185542 RepID=A0ABC8S5J6_9AQUA
MQSTLTELNLKMLVNFGPNPYFYRVNNGLGEMDMTGSGWRWLGSRFACIYLRFAWGFMAFYLLEVFTFRCFTVAYIVVFFFLLMASFRTTKLGFGIPKVLYGIYLAGPLLFAPPLASAHTALPPVAVAAGASLPPSLWLHVGTARRCSPTANNTVEATVVTDVGL